MKSLMLMWKRLKRKSEPLVAAAVSAFKRRESPRRYGKEFTSIRDAVRHRDDVWQTGDARSFSSFVRGREDDF